jgi:hypothetical protein
MKEISMKITTSHDVLLDLTSTIERLENELLAATIRIDNDAMEIARLTPLQYRQAPCHKFCEATAFKVEIRELKAERDAAVAVWTSVDDALPEKNVECLVYWGDASGSPLIGVAQRCVPYEGILLWRGHGGSHNDVTHWMPLPKRPAPGAPTVKAGRMMVSKESS